MKDSTVARTQLDAVQKFGDRFGMRLEHRTKDGAEVYTFNYALGEGASVALNGPEVLVSGGAGHLDTLLDRAHGKGPGFNPSTSPGKALEQAGSAVWLDVAGMAQHIRAIPASAFGLGGFAIRAAVLHWVDAFGEIRGVLVSADYAATAKGGKLHVDVQALLEVIFARDLTKAYSDAQGPVGVLMRLSLEVPDGEMLAIVGRSGSGKTSLLNVLGALDSDFQGELQIQGKDIGHLTDSRAGAVSQRVGRVRLPVPPPHPERPRVAERGSAGGLRRSAAGRRAGARPIGAGARRAGGKGRAEALGAVGRRAAAGRAGPGPLQRPPAPALRRAHRKSQSRDGSGIVELFSVAQPGQRHHRGGGDARGEPGPRGIAGARARGR